MPSECEARHLPRSGNGNDGWVADIPVDKSSLLDAARSLLPPRPDAALGAPGPTRRYVVVAAAVGVVVALLILLGRSPAPARIAPPSTSLHTTSPSSSGGIYVHVAGAVRKPGLYELSPESRVADAIEAAGGALPKADIDVINLAQVVADGMKIAVPLKGGAPPAPPTEGAAGSGTALISINSATLEELETLPGVGPVTAQAIISFREESGPFQSLEGLLEVSGIGPATFAEIRPHVSL